MDFSNLLPNIITSVTTLIVAFFSLKIYTNKAIEKLNEKITELKGEITNLPNAMELKFNRVMYGELEKTKDKDSEMLKEISIIKHDSDISTSSLGTLISHIAKLETSAEARYERTLHRIEELEKEYLLLKSEVDKNRHKINNQENNVNMLIDRIKPRK